MPSSTSIGRDLGLARLAFVAMMAFWLLYPALKQGEHAQDAIPLVVAGELVHSHPDAIYVGSGGGLYDTKPEFLARSCTYYEDPAACRQYAVAFVSPPAALPLVVPLSWLGDTAFPVLRELGAIALVAAMALLWRRLTPLAPRAAWSFALAAMLMTPLVTTPIDLGQTSPLLFLAAAIPISSACRDRVRGGAFAAVMGAVIALKAFPLALLAVPALSRRWRAVVGPSAVVAALAALSFVVGPAHLWSDFFASAGSLSKDVLDNPFSSSVDSALGELGIRASAATWALRLVLGVPLVLALRRIDDVDVRWACAWAGTLVLFPQVWSHYSFVLLPAIVAVLVARPDRERWLVALPVVAALTVPIGILAGSGDGRPVVQLLCNLAGVAVALGVATRPQPAAVPAAAAA